MAELSYRDAVARAIAQEMERDRLRQHHREVVVETVMRFVERRQGSALQAEGRTII